MTEYRHQQVVRVRCDKLKMKRGGQLLHSQVMDHPDQCTDSVQEHFIDKRSRGGNSYYLKHKTTERVFCISYRERTNSGLHIFITGIIGIKASKQEHHLKIGDVNVAQSCSSLFPHLLNQIPE